MSTKKIVKGRWKNVEYIFYIYNAKRKTDKIFSIVLFIIEGSKKLEIYKEGVKAIINDVSRLFPEYNVRIYFDSTSASFVEQFINRDNVELYLYSFPQFYNKTTKTHFGMFGTLIRYLPLFDIPEHQSKQTIVFDVDNKLFKNSKIVINYFNKTSDMRLIYRNRFCYLDDRILKIGLKIKHPIISSLVCQRGTVPKEIFIDFINDCLLKSCQRYTKFLKDVYGKSNRETMLQYGVDEYFMNSDFINYYVDNKIPYSIFISGNSSVKGVNLWIKTSRNEIVKNPYAMELIDKILKLANESGNSNPQSKMEMLENILRDKKMDSKFNVDISVLVSGYDRKKLEMPVPYYECIFDDKMFKKDILIITMKDGKETIKTIR